MVQLDACPTGDQEVAGSIPYGSATFFGGDLIINDQSLPVIDLKRAVVSFWRKNVHITG